MALDRIDSFSRAVDEVGRLRRGAATSQNLVDTACAIRMFHAQVKGPGDEFVAAILAESALEAMQRPATQEDPA